MKGNKIGYKRVSTVAQNEERQLVEIEADLDKIFIDKCSGATTNRPQLELLRLFVREGDELFIHHMDRLARNLKDLIALVEEFVAKKVTVHFTSQHMIFDVNSTSHAFLMLNIMGSCAEFERKHNHERLMEGVMLAKARGVYKGRSRAVCKENFDMMKERLEMGMDKPRIAKLMGIGVATIYRYLKAEKEGKLIFKER